MEGEFNKKKHTSSMVPDWTLSANMGRPIWMAFPDWMEHTCTYSWYTQKTKHKRDKSLNWRPPTGQVSAAQERTFLWLFWHRTPLPQVSLPLPLDHTQNTRVGEYGPTAVTTRTTKSLTNGTIAKKIPEYLHTWFPTLIPLQRSTAAPGTIGLDNEDAHTRTHTIDQLKALDQTFLNMDVNFWRKTRAFHHCSRKLRCQIVKWREVEGIGCFLVRWRCFMAPKRRETAFGGPAPLLSFSWEEELSREWSAGAAERKLSIFTLW